MLIKFRLCISCAQKIYVQCSVNILDMETPVRLFLHSIFPFLSYSLSEDGIYSESSTPVLNTDARCPGVCQGVSTDETTGEIKLELTIDQQQFFHPRHDYDFTNRKDTLTFWRGDEKYERPCGYKRFGLKVSALLLYINISLLQYTNF